MTLPAKMFLFIDKAGWICCPWAIVFNENEDPQNPTEISAGARLCSIILRQKERKWQGERGKETFFTSGMM